MAGGDMTDWYSEGKEAYRNSKEMWECPYVLETSLQGALLEWLAGWMFAKQLDNREKA